jgi:hypothetical protein
LIFRTDATSEWGEGKGSPLRADEVDSNFWILLTMVLALESNQAQPAEISSINVVGDAMTITLSDGTVFGPYTLPVATFHWVGPWTAGAALKKYDIVTANRSAYLVLRDHTADPTFDPARTDVGGDYYKVIFEYPVDFDIGFFFPGTPGTGIADGKPLFAYKTARDFYLLATLPASLASLGTATTGALSFPILKNGTAIGSVDFAASATAGTFSFAADVQFAPGDVLKITKPAGALDATAADLNVTLAGVKGLLEVPSSS